MAGGGVIEDLDLGTVADEDDDFGDFSVGKKIKIDLRRYGHQGMEAGGHGGRQDHHRTASSPKWSGWRQRG